ncbi:hypothetical protein MHBO_001273 [Bonamia ostreae]|uniref:Uncharacterized protein n=1 Tax=Bonamia ostreae TaxID=126728 RepID=A0ABV2AJ01_9EUKA
MKICSETKSSHSLVLQDDILVARNLFLFLSRHFHPFSKDCDDWLWIKLFNSEQFFGYSINEIFNIASFCVLLSSVSVFAMYMVTFGSSSSFFSRKSILLQFSLFAIFLTMIFASNAHRRLSKFEQFYATGAGVYKFESHLTAVANLYQTEKMASISRYIVNMAIVSDRNVPVDRAIKWYGSKRNLKEYVFFPSVVQHIGMVSSNPRNRYNGSSNYIRSRSYDLVFGNGLY